MDSSRPYTGKVLLAELAAVMLALLFLMPFYFALINSFKSFGDLLTDSAGWPKSWHPENYSKAWRLIQFPKVFANSLVITVASNLGLVVISSMAAHRMVRYPSRFNRALFGLFVASMIIPFQSIMIPLVKVVSTLGIQNSRLGIMICYFGFGAMLSVFLYHGYVKSIPKEIEESAVVDGCSPYGVFWRIVFPLLKPMTVTVLLLNSLWIWNDFLLPLLILSSPGLRTIPLAASSFFAQYTKQWDLGLASLVLGVIPIVIFFLSMQKHIIEGITAGSVKG
jgi:raffinose/stachyose/melibiose transport system permease protein